MTCKLLVIVILIALYQVNQNVCSVQLNLLRLKKVIRFGGADVSGSKFLSLAHHWSSFPALCHFSLFP